MCIESYSASVSRLGEWPVIDELTRRLIYDSARFSHVENPSRHFVIQRVRRSKFRMIVLVLHHLEQLLAKIDEVEARDPRIAEGLRRLAEGFQYQKLLDLFRPGVPIESGQG